MRILPPPVRVIAFCLCGAFVSTPVLCSQPGPNADTLKWETLVANKLKQESPPPGSVLCIGSSHMALWKTIQTDLAPLHVHNYGIEGSRMSHAAKLFVPKFVIPFKPRAVLLYEGSNDLAADKSPGEVLAQFRLVHEQIHEALPETRLYVLGLVPNTGKRFERWDAIRDTNNLLRKECEENPWIKFIDTTTPLMTPKGLPRPECFIPGNIHMTEAGYEAWTSVVAPAVVPTELPFEAPEK